MRYEVEFWIFLCFGALLNIALWTLIEEHYTASFACIVVSVIAFFIGILWHRKYGGDAAARN